MTARRQADSHQPLVGAIEAGGTKFVCAVGRSPETVSEPRIIPTSDPATTMAAVLTYFRSFQRDVAAFGIASFGPADVDAASPRYGTILKTPKPGWSDFDLKGALAGAFDVPVGFDTDVNGAALAEATCGAGQDARVVAYVTVGTGIGGGFCIDCKPLHGKHHPEAGHIFPRRHPADMAFAGICPFHGDCLEGLAAGPAILKRWGQSLSQLPPEHEAHEIIAFYLGQCATSLIAIAAADVVVFGGGVLGTPGLLDRIRSAAARFSQNYWGENLADMIRAPGLGTKSGITGALLLARATLMA